MKENVLRARMLRWLCLASVSASLLITPWLTFDPINLGKTLSVVFFGFLFLGLLLANLTYFRSKIDHHLLVLGLLVFIGLVTNLLLAPSPLSQKLWGVFGRNNGVLSYSGLTLLLLCAFFIQAEAYYRKLLFLLPLTGIPVLFYSFIQILDKDPVKWSFYAPFATFGNVNFLSAFLGMVAVALVGVAAFLQESILGKFMCYVGAAVSLGVILKTDSIQGVAVFSMGLLVLLYFFLRKKNIFLFLGFNLASVCLIAFAALAFLNIGPFAKLIYQESITFRFDYMHAAFKTFLSHPLIGVGMDGFGDWYRNYRGAISAFRTGLSRTSNSAHNIFLDIAAGGGLVLALPIVGIFLLTLVRSYKVLTRTNDYPKTFLVLFSVWVGYIVQSLISINQIAIGVWGWMFTGALLGYSRLMLNPREENVRDYSKAAKKLEVKLKSHPKKRRAANLAFDARTSIFVFLTGLIGFGFAFLPLKADMDIRSYSNKGNLKAMMSALGEYGTTSYHFSQVAFQAGRGGFQDQAEVINQMQRERFPRDFGAWLMYYSQLIDKQKNTSLVEKRISDLDPMFFCLNQDSVSKMESLLFALPDSKQREIASFWKLLPGGSRQNKLTFRELPRGAVQRQLQGMCS